MYGNQIYANEPFAGGNQQPIQLWNIQSRDSGAWSKQSFNEGFLLAAVGDYLVDNEDSKFMIKRSSDKWTKVGHE